MKRRKPLPNKLAESVGATFEICVIIAYAMESTQAQIEHICRSVESVANAVAKKHAEFALAV